MDAGKTIRPATREDLAGIRRISNWAILNTAASFKTAEESLDHWIEQWKTRKTTHPWLVAEVDGRVAGYALSVPYDGRCGFSYTAETSVYIDPDLELYIVDLVQKTREHNKIAVGASPRGALALLKLARAWAAMHERDYVTPDDIKTFFHPVLNHRIILTPNLWNSRVANENILTEILNSVPVPVIQGI